MFVGEKLMCSRGDRFDLFARVHAGQEDCRALGYGRIQINRDKLRFSQRFFPIAYPCGVEIVCLLARMLQDDGGVLRRLHRRA